MLKKGLVALLLVTCALVLGATVFQGQVASAAQAILPVNVTNDAAHAVPVQPKLWQGTPHIASHVVLGGQCEDFAEVPAGKTFYVLRIVARFNHAPGATGSAAVRFTPLGASGTFLSLPDHVSSSAQQVAGVYDQFSGVLELGQPTNTTMQACLFASAQDDIRGSFFAIGYLLDAS
jgi:hypothetical protein